MDLSLTTAVAFAAGLALGVLAATLVPTWRRRRRPKSQLFEGDRATPTLEQAMMIGGQAAVKGAIRTAARVREGGVGAAFRAPIEAMATWAELEHPELRRVAGDGSVTILFSDIEDSTKLNEELGDRHWVKLLGAHDKLVRREVAGEDGFVVKSQGDGFMIAFAEPTRALRCAVAVQRKLGEAGGQLKRNPIRVRIGIHTGKAVTREGDLYGRNVAMAARVAQQAQGGEILVSGSLAAQVKVDGEDELTDITWGATREVDLKGLGSEELVQVAWT